MEIMVVMPMISILSVTSLASTIQADLSLFLATNTTHLAKIDNTHIDHSTTHHVYAIGL